MKKDNSSDWKGYNVLFFDTKAILKKHSLKKNLPCDIFITLNFIFSLPLFHPIIGQKTTELQVCKTRNSTVRNKSVKFCVFFWYFWFIFFFSPFMVNRIIKNYDKDQIFLISTWSWTIFCSHLSSKIHW